MNNWNYLFWENHLPARCTVMVCMGLSISSIFGILGTKEIVDVTTSFLFLGLDFIIWKTGNVDVGQESFVINCICIYIFLILLAVKITITKVYNQIRPFFHFVLGAACCSDMSLLSLRLESELGITVVDFLQGLFSVGNNIRVSGIIHIINV